MDSSTYTEVDHTDVESIMEKVVSKSREMEKVFDSISELIYSIVEICDSNKLDPSIFIPNYKKF
jgi:K+/H+ antiporter YhaU regulatory subunit KhtT